MPAPPPSGTSTPTKSFPGSVTPGSSGPGLVSRQAASIASESSPLMQAAMTRGRQYAESRGLLNSSLGAEASGMAVIDSAAQLAQADVSAAQTAEGQRIARESAVLQDRARVDSLQETQRQFDAGYKLNAESLRVSTEQAARQLELAGKQFESDEARRTWVQRLESEQLDLARQQQNFAQQLDRERFQSDQAYRNKALEQAERLAMRQVQIDAERLGVDKARLTVDKQLSIINADRQLLDSMSATIATVSQADFLDEDQKKAWVENVKKGVVNNHDALVELYGTRIFADEDEEAPPPPPPGPQGQSRGSAGGQSRVGGRNPQWETRVPPPTERPYRTDIRPSPRERPELQPRQPRP